jgi:hypothetical protein
MNLNSKIVHPGIKRIIEALSACSAPEPSWLLQLVGCAGITASDIEPWADYSHSPRDSYGRQLVWHGGHFELMVMTWLPGDFSAIHDHGHAEWGAVQSFGAAEHYSYRLDRLHLCDEVALPYAPGQVRLVPPGLIHQMGNPLEESFLSLHVYGCKEAREPITACARVFDPEEGCIQYTNGGVFFGLPETEILDREPGLTAEPLIRKRQVQLKAFRLQRMIGEMA